MTFLCVVCAKTVRGRQLLVGVAREERVSGVLLAFYYIWLMTVMAQYRLGRGGKGAAPRGRQLVQDYVLCTAPPLTFMALPFGGCGCSVAPFFPRLIPLPFFLSLLLPLLSATQRVYVIF